MQIDEKIKQLLPIKKYDRIVIMKAGTRTLIIGLFTVLNTINADKLISFFKTTNAIITKEILLIKIAIEAPIIP